MNINCFVTGILDRLNHIVDVGSQTIYIYSMYESNDNDHNVVVNQMKIDSKLGTVDDFDMLLSKLQEKKSMYPYFDYDKFICNKICFKLAKILFAIHALTRPTCM